MILRSDEGSDRNTDRRTGSEADRESTRRRVGAGEEQPDAHEDCRSDDWADGPGEKSAAGAHGESVAVQDDAEECADAAGGHGEEPGPSVAHFVEEQVRPDPQGRTPAHGHRDRDHGAAHLGLGEEEEDDDQERDRSQRPCGVPADAALVAVGDPRGDVGGLLVGGTTVRVDGFPLWSFGVDRHRPLDSIRADLLLSIVD